MDSQFGTFHHLTLFLQPLSPPPSGPWSKVSSSQISNPGKLENLCSTTSSQLLGEASRPMLPQNTTCFRARRRTCHFSQSQLSMVAVGLGRLFWRLKTESLDSRPIVLARLSWR